MSIDVWLVLIKGKLLTNNKIKFKIKTLVAWPFF